MNKNIFHILVVDDDDRIRELVKEYLEENQFLVTTAKDALDAKKKIEIVKFDILILDIMMPGESGLSLTKEIKKNNPTPIILLTAKGEVKDRIEGLELGADDFESENDVIEITTSQEAFGDVSSGLEKEGFEIEGEVGLTPINSVNVSGNDAKQLLLLLEKLEDHEDIQKVYSNFDLDESEMGFLL